jgi:hypothetical protein
MKRRTISRSRPRGGLGEYPAVAVVALPGVRWISATVGESSRYSSASVGEYWPTKLAGGIIACPVHLMSPLLAFG